MSPPRTSLCRGLGSPGRRRGGRPRSRFMNTAPVGGATPCRAEAATIHGPRRLVQDETRLRDAAGRDGHAARGWRPPRPRLLWATPAAGAPF